MITIALALGGLQLLWVAMAWLVSPVRPLAYLTCGAWILGCVALVRHRAWIGGLPHRWQRWLCLLLWQLPGLSSGVCSLAIFTGVWQAPAIAVFLLQAWLAPLAPLIALVPRASCHAVADYLWVTACLPCIGYGLSMALAWHAARPRAPGDGGHIAQVRTG